MDEEQVLVLISFAVLLILLARVGPLVVLPGFSVGSWPAVVLLFG